MFVVYMQWADSRKDLCVVAETREKAKEWIAKKMDGKRYNGLGYYAIAELELVE